MDKEQRPFTEEEMKVAVAGNQSGKSTKFRALRVTNSGVILNPLTKLPRNMKCPCFSGKKFKVCCLPDTDPYIKVEDGERYAMTYNSAINGEHAW